MVLFGAASKRKHELGMLGKWLMHRILLKMNMYWNCKQSQRNYILGKRFDTDTEFQHNERDVITMYFIM